MSNWRSEQGSTTTEFVLAVPLFAAAMLFLIGLGYTLMTKQNAIVGARGAVFYRVSLDDDPNLDDLASLAEVSTSPGREEWQVRDLGDSFESDSDLDGIEKAKPWVGFDLIQGLVSDLYQTLNHETGYQVSTTPTLGLLPRVLRFDRSVRAQSAYYLPRGTWTCGQTKGSSYVTIALSTLPIPKQAVQFFDPGCCETYDASR